MRDKEVYLTKCAEPQGHYRMVKSITILSYPEKITQAIVFLQDSVQKHYIGNMAI